MQRKWERQQHENEGECWEACYGTENPGEGIVLVLDLRDYKM